MDLPKGVQRLERRFRELEDVVDDIQTAVGGDRDPVPWTPGLALADPLLEP